MALLTCPDCEKRISDSAPVCPGCGRPMRSSEPTPEAEAAAPSKLVPSAVAAPNARTRTLWGVLVGLFLLFAAIRACGDNPKSSPPAAQASKPASQPARSEPTREPSAESALNVDLASLLAEYKDNEVRADGRFKGNSIQTSGVVGDVAKDFLGKVYVTIGTGAPFEIPTLQCFLAGTQIARASSLSKGDRIVIQGIVHGKMMNVLAEDCVIVK